jgi:murein DD-endopeptidase MepM/ murein hydrolase activator NlpD
VRTVRTATWGGVLCLTLIVGTGAAATPASAPPPPSSPAVAIHVSPASPVQGDTLIVAVTSPAGAHVVVRFDGDAVPTYEVPDGVRRALVGTDPDIPSGRHTVEVSVREDDGAWKRASEVVRIASGHFGVRSLTLPPATYGLINPQNFQIERRALGPVLIRHTPAEEWRGTFQVPSTGTMDSPYGLAGVYNGHRMWWHGGVDFSAPEGDPVVAANAGVVALAQMLPLGGGTVVIDHGQGVLTEYLHLSAFTVHPGDHVARGDQIGRIGHTGLVTGPSIHWGLYVNGIPVNPLFWTEPHPGLTS